VGHHFLLLLALLSSLFFVDLQLAVYGAVGTMRMIAYVVNTSTGITVPITSIIVKLFLSFFSFLFFPYPFIECFSSLLLVFHLRNMDGWSIFVSFLSPPHLPG